MTRLPPLAAIRAFEAAGRHENFSRAAEELGMTQAASSRAGPVTPFAPVRFFCTGPGPLGRVAKVVLRGIGATPRSVGIGIEYQQLARAAPRSPKFEPA